MRIAVATVLAMAGGATAVGLGAPGAGAAGAGPLGVLAAGRWEVHEIGAHAPPRSLCLPDPSALVQWRHWQMACTRFLLKSDGRTTTYHYTCPNAGNGLTTITAEGADLARIQTQGISGGQPFDLDLEARRVGTCR